MLTEEEKRYKCPKNHSFDKAKEGYVNLILQGGSHGDDKNMIKARRDFLDKGYYSGFALAICKALQSVIKDSDTLLDCGCGEGYYTEKFHSVIPDSSELYAIDISKFALKYAGKRLKNHSDKLAVATAYNLPFEDESINVITSIFSPFAREEFLRVMTKGAYLILGIADENHLFELKCAVYDNPYKNEVADFNIEGFEFIEEISAKEQLNIACADDIKNLFEMTPYAHKTSPADIKKLDDLSELTVSADFKVLIYRKK